MSHYAVLRHGFDVHENPHRLGPQGDEPFWLGLGHGGSPPAWLVGNTVWLVSWEGVLKMKHMLWGWYSVAHVGTRAGVAAQHFASGRDGVLLRQPIGPLDGYAWFARFRETHRGFRDGEPTDISEYLDDLVALTKGAGARAPADSWEHVVNSPSAL